MSNRDGKPRLRRARWVIAGLLGAALVAGSLLRLSDVGRDGPPRGAMLAEAAPPDSTPSEAPTVLPFATVLDGPAETASAEPRRPRPDLVAPENADGCDHSYGTSICVPWIFGADITTARQRCVWLRKHGFGRITVAGRDRHGLDPDHDEIACDDRATA